MHPNYAEYNLYFFIDCRNSACGAAVMSMRTIKGLSSKRRRFLQGTLLLTGAGFFCRILGFFYRIFLSRAIGAEGLGLFQLMHPVFGICFALCAGSMQTALSQTVAAHAAHGRRIFQAGLILSLGMALLLGTGVCMGAEFLARFVLLEPQCAPFLPYLGLSVPFAAFHACVNGYYYGTQRSEIPALSQITEQLLRMAFVFACAQFSLRRGRPLTVSLAAAGHLAGEAAAAAFALLCLAADARRRSKNSPRTADAPGSYQRQILALAVPLMGNRLVLNLLASAEAILIPACLQESGLSPADALSVCGVLNGMALPFVLFPSAIANSMAVLLLPGVAQAQAEGNREGIRKSIVLSLRYSLSMGILCIGIFLLFGQALGQTVFHSMQAGRFIRVLAWLCPFLYLATTLGSILNGLGRTHTTFLQNAAAMALRLGFVLFGVPRFGIRACLTGMLAGELFLAALHLNSLREFAPLSWNAADLILKPAALLLVSVGILRFVTGTLELLPVFSALPVSGFPGFLLAAAQIALLGSVYTGLLLLQMFPAHARETG